MIWSASSIISLRARDDDGIPQITELLQRMDEAHIVSLVEADARLIKDIEYLDELSTDLRRQTDALALAPEREAVMRFIER